MNERYPMSEKTKFVNLDQRIELFNLIITLNHEYVRYFGNANSALIMNVLMLEQYNNFREYKYTDYSIGVTLAYIAERTGLPKSTVHDQLKKMLKKEIFIKEGTKFKFKLNSDGLPLIQSELPNGLVALRRFSNFLHQYEITKE